MHATLTAMQPRFGAAFVERTTMILLQIWRIFSALTGY
jgi:hypothetical protein